jgi:hypothetical protein
VQLEDIIIDRDKEIKTIKIEMQHYEKTINNNRDTIKALKSKSTTKENFTDDLIKEFTKDIIDIATEQKKKPINFYNKEQTEYSHAKFLTEVFGSVVSFLSRLLDSIAVLASTTVNDRSSVPLTGAEKEDCLAYLIACIMSFVLRNGFNWDHIIAAQLLLYTKTRSDIVCNIVAKLCPGSLGGATVSFKLI